MGKKLRFFAFPYPFPGIDSYRGGASFPMPFNKVDAPTVLRLLPH